MKLKHKNLAVFSVAALLTVGVVAFVYVDYLATPYLLNLSAQSVIHKGLGGGPIPVNTLYTEPNLPSPNSTSPLLLEGANRDTLYTAGVLDLSAQPDVLHVPDTGGRYYSVQLVDSRGDDFAYVGSRTTGTQAGNFLISGPGWHGTVPNGVTQIASPDNRVFLIGRVLVQNDSDVSTAYALSEQIHLTPLSQWQPAAG
jgi:hypothetical protein